MLHNICSQCSASTQHQLFPPSIPCSVAKLPPSIPTLSTQHPDENRALISLSGAYHDFIPHILQYTNNSSRYTRLQQWKASLWQLTGMPWIVTFRAPPWWMLGGIPPSITVWGVRTVSCGAGGLVPCGAGGLAPSDTSVWAHAGGIAQVP